MADAKSNEFENSLVSWIFNATTIAGLGEGSATPTSILSLQLHTASPGEAGTCATNEASYTGYNRVPVARNSSGWTVSGSSAKLTATAAFPQCTAGSSQSITFFSVGLSTVVGSTGIMLYYGAVSPTINVEPGVTPQLTTNTAVSEL